MPTGEAIDIAEREGLDLVEVAPNADPPVCRIMDFGKYKYQTSKKEQEARKKGKASDGLDSLNFHFHFWFKIYNGLINIFDQPQVKIRPFVSVDIENVEKTILV